MDHKQQAYLFMDFLWCLARFSIGLLFQFSFSPIHLFEERLSSILLFHPIILVKVTMPSAFQQDKNGENVNMELHSAE